MCVCVCVCVCVCARARARACVFASACVSVRETEISGWVYLCVPWHACGCVVGDDIVSGCGCEGWEY